MELNRTPTLSSVPQSASESVPEMMGPEPTVPAQSHQSEAQTATSAEPPQRSELAARIPRGAIQTEDSMRSSRPIGAMQSQPLRRDLQMQAIPGQDPEAGRERLIRGVARYVDNLSNCGISLNDIRFLSGCQRILEDGYNNVLTDFLRHAARGGGQYLLQAKPLQVEMRQRLLRLEDAASLVTVHRSDFVWRLYPSQRHSYVRVETCSIPSEPRPSRGRAKGETSSVPFDQLPPRGRGRREPCSNPSEPRPPRGRGDVRDITSRGFDLPRDARPIARDDVRRFGPRSQQQSEGVAEQSNVVTRKEYNALQKDNAALKEQLQQIEEQM